jgi:c-di-GMP-binding flagellar brake protein YcgR
VPANRSRTTEWRRCLHQLHERSGALEIAIARDYEQDGEMGSHLVWRVRIIGLNEREIILEQPMALGQDIRLAPGLQLIAILAIGQNRWMFRTQVIASIAHQIDTRRDVQAVRVAMPTTVERCQRRNYYRVETAALRLPEVHVWPLLDPRSVLLAEHANELLAAELDRHGPDVPSSQQPPQQPSLLSFTDQDNTLPDVGPKFTTMLLNIGGGGMGLRVEPSAAHALGHHKLFWLRFSLPPELKTPICATGKLVHTHMDSQQFTYAGMAFDFTFNPAHQRFVVDQICRYIAIQQREQLARLESATRTAKSA